VYNINIKRISIYYKQDEVHIKGYFVLNLINRLNSKLKPLSAKGWFFNASDTKFTSIPTKKGMIIRVKMCFFVSFINSPPSYFDIGGIVLI
jgi:hypothetical protein